MINNVVLHYLDGTIAKGTTENFFPNKVSFHLRDLAGGTCEVALKQLKAVFFVKTFEGRPDYDERDDLVRTGFGRRVRLHFNDGETLVGYTQGYTPERPGFFLFPCDPESNNDRIFAVSAATDKVEFL